MATEGDTSKYTKGQVKLSLPDGREIHLDALAATIGEEIFIDIRGLYGEHKILTYDPGFNSTASCKSAITYIDGDKGLCLYRGHPVHELVENRIPYLDVCYLILYGSIPTPAAKSAFEKQVRDEMLLHEQLKVFVQTFIYGSHPMSILSSVVSAMASFYADPMDGEHVHDQSQRELACVRLTAKMPAIVALIYRVKMGMPLLYPRPDLNYAENFLYMMFGNPVEPYKVDNVKAEALNALLVIHADHEQNASTSTVRTAGSSLANPYACIAAGITSLWGRAHGGANEAVIKMLQTIGSVENVDSFVAEVKAKKMRLMGFGHRIYRNWDPRAKLMCHFCHKLFEHTGTTDPLFAVALKLEKTALEDNYFVSRKLYPNVDFYSGMVMRSLNIPIEFFTVMFAFGRCIGWLAHWKEMLDEKQLKICRPRQLYCGVKEAHVQTSCDSTDAAFDCERPFHSVQAELLTTGHVRRRPALTSNADERIVNGAV